MIARGPDFDRIVITGVGLTAPNGNSLAEFRAEPAGRPQRRGGLRDPLLRPHGGGGVQLRRAPLPTPQGPPPRHPGRQRRHLLHAGSRCRRRPGLGKRRQIDRRHLRRRDRARQRRDGERDLPPQGVRLRHPVLVAPSQSAHRGQQPGRRDFAEPGRSPGRTTRSGRPARRATPALSKGCRCCGWATATWPWPAASRRAFTPSASSPASTARGPWPATATRPRPRGPSTPTATASWWPKGAACTCWSGWRTPRPAARRSTARWPATR